MSYTSFSDLVSSFDNFSSRTALTVRRGLRIERFSYAQLQKLALRNASLLKDFGVAAGDRVMIIAENSPEWVALFLGGQLISSVVVPIDADSTIDAARKFAYLTEPKLIARGRNTLPELDNDFQTLVLEELSTLPVHESEGLSQAQQSGDLDAVIAFTSGTTAAPKGVRLTQWNILSNIEGVQGALEIDPDWRLLSVLPLSHMYELTAGCLAPLSKGCSIHYLDRVTTRSIAKAMRTYRISTIVGIPELLVLMLSQIRRQVEEAGRSKIFNFAMNVSKRMPFEFRRYLFSQVHTQLGGRLDLVVVGGAPVPPDVAETWELMGVRVIQGYGLTETSPILTMNRLNDRRTDSAGLPLDNVALRIGPDGEIQATGPNVFPGYLKNPEATRSAFTDDGWFKTGDVGNIEEGWLKIRGRLKFVIALSSGVKVFPEDIEAAAEGESVIKELCIVGIVTDVGEEVRAVIISGKSDAEVSKAISRINSRVSSSQHIGNWVRWPNSTFPRTRLMKIDRRNVQEWARSGHAEASAAAEARRDDVLEDILCTASGNTTMRITESSTLADLGLDSLRRMSALALIEDRLRKTIVEETVTGHTTVAELRTMTHQAPVIEALREIPRWQFHPAVRKVGYTLRERLLFPVVHHWVDLRIEGTDNILGMALPALFIFNHTDDFDGPVLYQALPESLRRRLAVAVADDVLEGHKVLALAARLCYAAFNMSRTEPYGPSLEFIGELVDQGWNVVIAPEGKLSETGRLQPFKQGIGLLATNLQIPVVPLKIIGLTGTVPLHAKWPHKHSRVTVRIGEPMMFRPQNSPLEVTERLHRSLEAL